MREWEFFCANFVAKRVDFDGGHEKPLKNFRGGIIKVIFVGSSGKGAEKSNEIFKDYAGCNSITYDVRAS